MMSLLVYATCHADHVSGGPIFSPSTGRGRLSVLRACCGISLHASDFDVKSRHLQGSGVGGNNRVGMGKLIQTGLELFP
jgi:hypothetical protein